MTTATTDLCDDFIEELQVAEPIFRHFGAQRAFHGPVRTVKAFEDNVLFKQALEDVAAGSVVVLDGGGSKRCALMGDKLAAIAERRGLAGGIVYGCVRDSAELATMDLGIMALAAYPVKSVKRGEGQRDIAVQFAGVRWVTGSYVYADEDGIILAERPLHHNSSPTASQ